MQDPKGDYLPPPPPPLYQVTSDIPPDSPYHYAPAPSRLPARVNTSAGPNRSSPSAPSKPTSTTRFFIWHKIERT